MSHQPRELESYFQEIGATSAAQEKNPAQTEDFNTFFERLSSLDDLTWNDGETVDASFGDETDPRIAVRPRPSRASRRGPRRMNVLHSDEVAPQRQTAGGTPSAAAPGMEPDDEVTDAKPGRPFPSRAMLLLKATLGGTALFAVGLLGGWLALSLPQQDEPRPVNLEQRLATVEQRAENQREALRPPPTPPEKDAAQPAVQRDATRSASAQPASDRTATVRTDAANGTAQKQVSAEQSTATAQEGESGGFALQVGACSSYRCVERYRQLLLTHVDSDAIRIHKQTTDAGTIQRVRVEPLQREQAQRLKRELAAMDQRLGQAYLVSLQ